jgi:hypothetical protein
MDMADWSGVPFRRMLSSAERLSDSAIFLGSFQVNTPGSRSSALLRFVTSADQRRGFDVLFPSVRSCSDDGASLPVLMGCYLDELLVI